MQSSYKAIPFRNVSSFYGDVKDYVDEASVVERKSVGTDMTASVTAGATVIEAIFSTPVVDHDGDIVWSQGIAYDYFSGAAIWNHKLDAPPVGRVHDLDVSVSGLKGRITLAVGYAPAEDLAVLARQNILRGISIGFIPKQILLAGTPQFQAFASANGLNTAGCKRIIASCYLLEVSLCVLGCNRQALIQAVATKAITVSDSTQRQFDLDPDVTAAMTQLAEKFMDEVKQLKAVAVPVAVATEPEPVAEAVVEPVVEAVVEAVTEPVVEPVAVEPVAVEPVVATSPYADFKYRRVIADVVMMPRPDPDTVKAVAKSLHLGRLI